MKKLVPLFIIFILFLTACHSKANYVVSLEKTPFYKEGVPAAFVVKIAENKKATANLNVHATFEMATMNHDTIELDLTGSEKGQYEGNVELPMPGDYDVFLTIDDGKDQQEEHITLNVKKENAVAKINDQKIYQSDLDFYRFINKLHIAIYREIDQKKYTGDEYTNAMNDWDAEEKAADNENMLLTQVIRLRAIALLGEEKGYTASDKEITDELQHVKEEYKSSKIGMKMIQDFGESSFWEKEKSQYAYIVLSNKVQQDVIAKAKQENPNLGDKEIMYMAQKEYEDILVSQVNSLSIEFYNRAKS